MWGRKVDMFVELILIVMKELRIDLLEDYFCGRSFVWKY